MAEFKPTVFRPQSFRRYPEQQQAGNDAKRVAGRFVFLHVATGYYRKRQASVSPCPLVYVSGVCMGQGALHQLARHEGRFGVVRVRLNLRHRVEKLFLIAGQRSGGFHLLPELWRLRQNLFRRLHYENDTRRGKPLSSLNLSTVKRYGDF